ncbi:NUDIX hydrolase [Streptomyces sp. NBC_00038]|uniref:NUDIX hydrolase n=1 Tax=Streptomyces sp. NBC_00038 TaxID=2903615 RepID=UPI00225936B3|nr:NUDIX domain-containing protein [Streptomyces sp. NBC_00038]MCX5563692.1 NUDIX domain-containing protein [Streptomyces sp. NBC_00038]
MGELVERVDERDEVLAVVDRDDAMLHGWRHRVAGILCRDTEGRVLVHRRPDDVPRFPGQFNWLLGGAAKVGESYEDAAARELSEELGVRGRPQLVLKYRCTGPYWLALHEIVVRGPSRPDPSEIAWHDWLTEHELAELVDHEAFIPEAREAFDRYNFPPRPPKPR